MGRRPWHLWLVGLVTLVWHAGGAVDYLMTQLQVASYMAMLSDAARAYLDSRPVWFDAAWAIAVWGSVLGSILILMRSGWSQLALIAALIAYVACTVWSYLIASPSAPEVLGASIGWFTAAVAFVIIFAWVYARAMTARGILR
jgi:hypothetical protein